MKTTDQINDKKCQLDLTEFFEGFVLHECPIVLQEDFVGNLSGETLHGITDALRIQLTSERMKLFA
jgi:hypothetical protein